MLYSFLRHRIVNWLYDRQYINLSPVMLGIYTLDKKVEDWALRVDPDVINLGQSDDCILGQVFGNFTLGRRALELTWSETFSFGFHAKWWQRDVFAIQWAIAVHDRIDEVPSGRITARRL